MTEPNPTPGADVLADARRAAAFRDAIAFELKGTPLGHVQVSTRKDDILHTKVIRASVGLTIEGAVDLEHLGTWLDGVEHLDAFLDGLAHRVGQDMRHEWDKATGAVERRAILRQAVIDLAAAIGERDHESRDRRLEGVIARLEGLAR